MLGRGIADYIKLILRRWRQHLGVSAPRVAVKTELPWHWRLISVVLLAGVSLSLAGWIYDSGRRFAGFHHDASDQEITRLREQVRQLSDELDQTRKVANSSDSRLKIESTAQDRLVNQVKVLEEENARLKSDLAMFENLVSGQGGPSAIEITRLQVAEEGTKGSYRFRLLVVQKGSGRDREVKGELQLTLELQRGKDAVMIELPGKGEANLGQYNVAFRYFGRMEGVFTIPPAAQIKRIEARILESGVVKASRSFAY